MPCKELDEHALRHEVLEPNQNCAELKDVAKRGTPPIILLCKRQIIQLSDLRNTPTCSEARNR